MPVVSVGRAGRGHRGLLRRVCILLGRRESRQLDHNGLALACKFELDDGACRADDVRLDDFALDADTIVVAGPHQPIAHAHPARQVDGPAPLDVAHNTAATRLLGGLLQSHAHTTKRPRPIVGTCGRCIISPRICALAHPVALAQSTADVPSARRRACAPRRRAGAARRRACAPRRVRCRRRTGVPRAGRRACSARRVRC